VWANDTLRRMPRDLDDALGDGGLAFVGYGEGWAEARWTPTALASNPLGTVHGGVYGVIHDAAMNFAVSSALERGARAATLDVSYQTVRPSQVGVELSVRGEVVRLTRSVAYLESTVRDGDEAVVSRAAGTFFVRRRET
jgi:uncharacterized protein (TIGR00369 family)